MFREWGIYTQKITTTMNISSKNFFTKKDLVYIYYINLVEATTIKFRLTCRELRSSCTDIKVTENYLPFKA